MVLWIGKFDVSSRRTMTAWMDTHEHNIPPIEDARFNAMLTVAQRQELQAIQVPNDRVAAASH